MELVSFNLCPFVQRSVITLLQKDQPFDITYIDLSKPPEWFTRISPLGKVPLLKVGDEVLFESAVINEFIDETTSGDDIKPLMPENALLRARNRAWIEFGSNLISAQYRLTVAKDDEKIPGLIEEYVDLIRILEAELGDGPYFNGEKLSLTDTAFAPVFTREVILGEVQELYDPSEFPKYTKWRDALLALPSVQQSVLPDFREIYIEYFTKSASALVSKIS